MTVISLRRATQGGAYATTRTHRSVDIFGPSGRRRYQGRDPLRPIATCRGQIRQDIQYQTINHLDLTVTAVRANPPSIFRFPRPCDHDPVTVKSERRKTGLVYNGYLGVHV